jgi:mono/diheme cytochrome c family protein
MRSRSILPRFGRLSLLSVLPVLLSACGSGHTVSGLSSPPSSGPVTLAEIQQKIFTPYCINCHVAGGSAPMPLTDVATSYAALVGADPTNSTARQSGQKRVVPGNADKSFLMHKVTGEMEFGEGDRMPQGANPLSAEEIDLIWRWIQSGAPSGIGGSG